MVQNEDLGEEDIDYFFKEHSNFFKAKPNKKLKKEIKKVLNNNIRENVISQKGPTVSSNEIRHLKSRLEQYFNSDYFLKFIRVWT